MLEWMESKVTRNSFPEGTQKCAFLEEMGTAGAQSYPCQKFHF